MKGQCAHFYEVEEKNAAAASRRSLKCRVFASIEIECAKARKKRCVGGLGRHTVLLLKVCDKGVHRAISASRGNVTHF